MTNTATFNTRNYQWDGPLPKKCLINPDFLSARHAHQCPNVIKDVIGGTSLTGLFPVKQCPNWTTGVGQSWCPTCVTKERMEWSIVQGIKKNKTVASYIAPESSGKALKCGTHWRKP